MCSITFASQVISNLISCGTTPLVVKLTMCFYLSINFNIAVLAYRRLLTAKRALDASACTVARKRPCIEGAGGAGAGDAGEGAGEGAGEDVGAGDAGEGDGEDAGGDAGAVDAYEAAGEGAGGAGVAGAGAEEIDAWEANAQQLCGLLKRPLAKGRKAFLKKSPAFQEWVWELLDCWEVTAGNDGAVMHESIRRLIEMPAHHNRRKAHHFDGLITWDTSERTGKLAPGFQYRASSIWRRVTRDMTAEALDHCKGYTPDHIHRVVEWFRANSIAIQPGQTAKMVKTAFKQAFGCMTEGCVTHADTALDVFFAPQSSTWSRCDRGAGFQRRNCDSCHQVL